jgi:hypothetical protein
LLALLLEVDDSKLFELERLRLPENEVIASVASVDVSSKSDLIVKLLEVATMAILPPVVGHRGRCSLLVCMVLFLFGIVIDSAALIEATDIVEVTAVSSSFISVNDELVESDLRWTVRRALMSWLKLRT